MNTLLSAAIAAILLASPVAAEIVVTDVKGREVRLDHQPERIVLSFYYEDFLAVGGGEAMDRVVALSRSTWEDWRPNQWKAYVENMPQIADLSTIGDTENGTFSIEKVISLRPDVVLMAAWSYDALGEGVSQLEAAGIPVVTLDYNAQTVEKHVASTLALGAVLGAEERAEALAKIYEEISRDTAQRVESASSGAEKVYVELAQKGPGTQGNSYAGGMWGGLVDRLGGDNIANGQVAKWGPLSPEYVLASDPDLIFLAGSEWNGAPEGVIVGFGADPVLARERMAGYLGRPGWSELKAVRNGDVFAIYHGGARTLSDFVYARYIAKKLHPEAFADVDPQAELRAYYDEWMPIPADGVYMLDYETK